MPPSDDAPQRPQRFAQLHEAAAQVGLTLQAHHLPGVAEAYARLAAQAEVLLAAELEEGDEPAPVYRP